MIERADDTSNASPPPDEAAPSGMIRQLGTILGAARRSPVGRALWLLAVAILVVILVTAYGQILLNRWNKPFYDALSRRDLRDFLGGPGPLNQTVGQLQRRREVDQARGQLR